MPDSLLPARGGRAKAHVSTPFLILLGLVLESEVTAHVQIHASLLSPALLFCDIKDTVLGSCKPLSPPPLSPERRTPMCPSLPYLKGIPEENHLPNQGHWHSPKPFLSRAEKPGPGIFEKLLGHSEAQTDS